MSGNCPPPPQVFKRGKKREKYERKRSIPNLDICIISFFGEWEKNSRGESTLISRKKYITFEPALRLGVTTVFFLLWAKL